MVYWAILLTCLWKLFNSIMSDANVIRTRGPRIDSYGIPVVLYMYTNYAKVLTVRNVEEKVLVIHPISVANSAVHCYFASYKWLLYCSGL